VQTQSSLEMNQSNVLTTTCPSLTLLGVTNGAFTLDVKLVLNENLGGILGGIQC